MRHLMRRVIVINKRMVDHMAVRKKVTSQSINTMSLRLLVITFLCGTAQMYSAYLPHATEAVLKKSSTLQQAELDPKLSAKIKANPQAYLYEQLFVFPSFEECEEKKKPSLNF